MNKIKKFDIGFTQISNIILNDANLSLKAKGLYSYLFSKPDDWLFHNEVILKEIKEGEACFKSCVKELEKFNYIKRSIIKEKGLVVGVQYLFLNPVVENPVVENPVVENPVVENPVVENPVVENRIANNNTYRLTNTNLSNTDLTNKNIFSNENICNEPDKINFENLKIDNSTSSTSSTNPKMLQLQKQAYLSFIDFKDDELTNQWKELMIQWLEYKQSIKSTYKSNISIKTCFENLLKLSNSELTIAREIVNNSIGNGYKGLFALTKSNQNNNKNKTETEKNEDNDYYSPPPRPNCGFYDEMFDEEIKRMKNAGK